MISPILLRTVQIACMVLGAAPGPNSQQPTSGGAAIRAVTFEGKEVLLTPDGKWEYAPQAHSDSLPFRKAKWGMDSKSVLASEKVQPVQNADGVMTFKDRLLGKDVYAAYIFAGDVLVRGKYVLSAKHMNATDYYTEDYDGFLKALTQKYGKPIKKEVIWKNDLYKDDPSEWGTAISVGHMIAYANWTVEDTEIALIIYGDNFDVTVAVEYMSKLLEPVEDKLRADEDQGKL